MKYALYDDDGNLKRVLTKKQLMKKVGKKNDCAFVNWLVVNTNKNDSRLDGYILCELDITDDPDYKFFDESKRYKCYVSKRGKVCRINKFSGTKEDISIHERYHAKYFHFNGRDNSLARAMYKLFINEIELTKNINVTFADGDEISLSNIKVGYQQQAINKKIGLYEDGDLKKVFASMGEAARYLGYRKQGLKYQLCYAKHPVYDLRVL